MVLVLSHVRFAPVGWSVGAVALGVGKYYYTGAGLQGKFYYFFRRELFAGEINHWRVQIWRLLVSRFGDAAVSRA